MTSVHCTAIAASRMHVNNFGIPAVMLQIQSQRRQGDHTNHRHIPNTKASNDIMVNGTDQSGDGHYKFFPIRVREKANAASMRHCESNK